MKQSAFFTFFYFILFPVWAQFTNPTKVIGTNLQFFTAKTVHKNTWQLEKISDQSTSFSFQPYFGKFDLRSNMLALGISYSHLNSKEYLKEESFRWPNNYIYKNTEKLSYFSIYGHGRVYKFLIPEVAAFLQFRSEIGYGNLESQTNLIEGNILKHLKGDSFSISLLSSVGILYKLNERFGLELNYGNFGYTFLYSNLKNAIRNDPGSQKNNTNAFGFDFGTTTIFFGTNFYLSRKPEEKEE